MPTFAPASRESLRCSPAERTRLTAASSKISREQNLGRLLAGELAQFCAAFYDASFDFDFGDELLRDRG